MTVIGIKHVSFKDRQTGNEVRGTRLNMMYPIVKDGEGYGVETIYLSEWFVNNRLNGMLPKLNDEVEPCYNKQGKLSDLRYISLAPQK